MVPVGKASQKRGGAFSLGAGLGLGRVPTVASKVLVLAQVEAGLCKYPQGQGRRLCLFPWFQSRWEGSGSLIWQMRPVNSRRAHCKRCKPLKTLHSARVDETVPRWSRPIEMIPARAQALSASRGDDRSGVEAGVFSLDQGDGACGSLTWM